MTRSTIVDRDEARVLQLRAYPELRGRHRRAMHRRLRDLQRSAQGSQPKRRRAERDRDDADDLPDLTRGRWGRPADRMWGPVGALVPMHVTSAADVGVLSPFMAAPTELLQGPAIGVGEWDGSVFRFDPWQAYRAGLVTSVGLCAWGTMGSGKTYALQTAALRAVGHGRHVIVEEDPKGDWTRLAQRVGGTVVEVGPGCRTASNPLAAPTPPAGVDERGLRRQVSSHRANLLRRLVSILREGKPFTEGEEPCLDAVVEAMQAGGCRASIPGVVDYLAQPPPALVDLVGAATVATLHLVLRRLVSGPLAGMVDTEQIIDLDPAAPMIVFDTSSLLNADDITRGIAGACLSSRVDALLQCGDGRFRIVIDEEAWAKLRNPYAAIAIDYRLRMTGHWRCSVWMIFHELNDIHQMSDLGAHREVVRGIISKSPIKVVFRQSPAALALYQEFVQPSSTELEQVRNLPPHVGIWRLGESVAVRVRARAAPSAHALFDNDAGRAG